MCNHNTSVFVVYILWQSLVKKPFNKVLRSDPFVTIEELVKSNWLILKSNLCPGHSESTFTQLNGGLPQGSVLAPLLFNVNPDDIQHHFYEVCLTYPLWSPTRIFMANKQSPTIFQVVLEEYFRACKLTELSRILVKTEVLCPYINKSLANYGYKYFWHC